MQSRILDETRTDSPSYFAGSEFPTNFVSELASQESHNRHLYRPGAYFHKWWARRCGTTFRSILKHLAARSGRPSDYYDAGGLNEFLVLDPMAGGGTTAYEASRLGARVIACDIDPVAATLIRAGLQSVNLQRLESEWQHLIAALDSELAALWIAPCKTCGENSEVQYTLHGRKGIQNEQAVVWVDGPILRDEPSDRWLLCMDCATPHQESDSHACETRAEFTLVPKEARTRGATAELNGTHFRERYIPLVDRICCANCGEQYQKYTAPSITLNSHGFNRDDFPIPEGPKSRDLLRIGVDSFLDTFSDRQLVFLSTVERHLAKVSDDHREHLALLFSTSLEFNSLLSGYKGAGKRRPGAVRHVFAHHAYSIPFTALENNPVFSKPTSGNLRLLFSRRLRAGLAWRENPQERGPQGGWQSIRESQSATLGTISQVIESEAQAAVANADSTELPIEGCVDFVVTDPPYYDSVQYSDLSWFFRVWLRRWSASDVSWNLDATKTMAHRSVEESTGFSRLLGGVFARANTAMKPSGYLAFTYHHWSPTAWAELTRALIIGGFVLDETIVVHSENPQSVHIKGLKALTHDAILILRKRTSTTKAWPEPTAHEGDSESFVRMSAQLLGVALAKFKDPNDPGIEQFWAKRLATGTD